MNQTQKKLWKLLILSDLLIQEIDFDDKEKTEIAKEIQDKAMQLQETLIPVVEMYFDQQKELSRTNIVQTLSRKFEYNIEKEL